jgi:hypothetical protein
MRDPQKTYYKFSSTDFIKLTPELIGKLYYLPLKFLTTTAFW